MWILRVIDEFGNIMDEAEYGGNSTNSLDTLHGDISYMINNPEDLPGNVLKLEYKETR